MSKLRLLPVIIAAMLGACSATALNAAPRAEQPRWEQVSDLTTSKVELTPLKGVKGVSSAIADRHLYLEVAEPTRIELFTILGQPILTADLKQGLHRLKLSSRGIYLLRIGNATVRIKY